MQKRKLEELNLLDDFLFGSMISYPGIGESFVKLLLKTILGKDLGKLTVIPQKFYYGTDTDHMVQGLMSIWKKFLPMGQKSLPQFMIWNQIKPLIRQLSRPFHEEYDFIMPRLTETVCNLEKVIRI